MNADKMAARLLRLENFAKLVEDFFTGDSAGHAQYLCEQAKAARDENDRLALCEISGAIKVLDQQAIAEDVDAREAGRDDRPGDSRWAAERARGMRAAAQLLRRQLTDGQQVVDLILGRAAAVSIAYDRYMLGANDAALHADLFACVAALDSALRLCDGDGAIRCMRAHLQVRGWLPQQCECGGSGVVAQCTNCGKKTPVSK